VLTVDPKTYQIVVDSGNQEKIQFTITNADGTPYNGTGATFQFVVKDSLDDLIANAKVNINSTTNAAQFDVTNAATGIVVVELLPGNTNTLGGKVYHYGFGVTDAAARPHLPRRGLIEVRKSVTL
jgi:hypothetical protein